MDFKYKIIISVVALALAFAAGRYAVPQTKSTETTKTTEQQQETQTQHQVTTIIKNPDGTEKTVTTIDTNTKINQKETISDTKQTVTVAGKKLNVSVLAGIDVTTAGHPFEYGISVSKQVAGPVTAGLWGMNNGTVGVSVGIDF